MSCLCGDLILNLQLQSAKDWIWTRTHQAVRFWNTYDHVDHDDLDQQQIPNIWFPKMCFIYSTTVGVSMFVRFPCCLMNAPSQCLTMLLFTNYHLSVGLIDTNNISMLDRIDWSMMRCGGSGGGVTYVTRWLSCPAEASEFKCFEATRNIERLQPETWSLYHWIWLCIWIRRSIGLVIKFERSCNQKDNWLKSIILCPNNFTSLWNYLDQNREYAVLDFTSPMKWMDLGTHDNRTMVRFGRFKMAKPLHLDITYSCTRVQSISITLCFGSIRSTPMTSICSQKRQSWID